MKVTGPERRLEVSESRQWAGAAWSLSDFDKVFTP
jgi:hypothetical protein